MNTLYKAAFLAVFGAVVFLSVGVVHGQTPMFTVRGLGLEDFYGNSVSKVGDVNHDGFVDFVVGEQNFGGVLCYPTGATTGIARLYSGVDGSTLNEWCGDPNDGQLGWSVAGAGDVDNDGTPDIIVGDIFANLTPTEKNYGSANVFSGADYSTLYTFYGDFKSSYFGDAVAGAGDVNADGYADVIVGAFFDDNGGFDAGLARVFSGKDGSILYSFTGDKNGDTLGSSVAGIGDINNDGFDDIFAGAQEANSAKGYARVFSGADGAILYTFNGDEERDNFGFSVSGLEDINGDNIPDFIVGAPGLSPTLTDIAGYVRIFSGVDGSTLYTLSGDNEKDWFGHAVSGAGDINSDSIPDILVGAPGDGFVGAPGYARIFSGADGSTLHELNGESIRDRFGYSVDDLGDMNGDGFMDFIIGASYMDQLDSLNPPGYVRIFSGSNIAIMGTGVGLHVPPTLSMRQAESGKSVTISGKNSMPHTKMRLYTSPAPELPSVVDSLITYLDTTKLLPLIELITDREGKWSASFDVPVSLIGNTYALQAFSPDTKEITNGLYVTVE